MILFENISKYYPDGTKAVNSLNLEIREGEFFVLIGPSGCGKTTTLKMMNRLIDANEGTIMINRRNIREYDIHELRWSIGYVLQQIALFPHMTIAENIAVVPELKKWEQGRIDNRINELLEMVGLDPKIYRERKPTELSGGQQQRIGVIRALAADPNIILMDEPFSALDPISREMLQDEILDLQRNIKKTIVFVTHDMQEALKLGDRICVMKEGEVVQIGTPNEILSNPANEFVRSFIGTPKAIFDGDVTIENFVQCYMEKEMTMAPVEVIPASTSLKKSLSLLAHHNELSVEKDGEWIGIITRETLIQYLAESLQESGEENG